MGVVCNTALHVGSDVNPLYRGPVFVGSGIYMELIDPPQNARRLVEGGRIMTGPNSSPSTSTRPPPSPTSPLSDRVALPDRRGTLASVPGGSSEEDDHNQSAVMHWAQVHGRHFTLHGSWIGHVSGGTDYTTVAFSRNHQIFITTNRDTKLEILVEQGQDKRHNENVQVFIFDPPASLYFDPENPTRTLAGSKSSHSVNLGVSVGTGKDGRSFGYIRRFLPRYRHWDSGLFMSTSASFVTFLRALPRPYVLVVTHRRLNEGGYSLHLQSEHPIWIRCPRNVTPFFGGKDQDSQMGKNTLVLEGKWTEESSGGAPLAKCLYAEDAALNEEEDRLELQRTRKAFSTSPRPPQSGTTAFLSSEVRFEDEYSDDEEEDGELDEEDRTRSMTSSSPMSPDPDRDLEDGSRSSSLRVPTSGSGSVSGASSPTSPADTARRLSGREPIRADAPPDDDDVFTAYGKDGLEIQLPKVVLRPIVDGGGRLVRNATRVSTLGIHLHDGLLTPGRESTPTHADLKVKMDAIRRSHLRAKPMLWLQNPQFPLIVTRWVKCFVTLRRTSPEPIPIGLFLLRPDPKSFKGDEEGSPFNQDTENPRERGENDVTDPKTKYYRKGTIERRNLVAMHKEYSYLRELHFRALLAPIEEPYVFVPVIRDRRGVGTFEIEVNSDYQVYKLKHDKVAKVIELSGMWMERTCGGKINHPEGTFFTCPQFSLRVDFAADSPYKPESGKNYTATLEIEQEVDWGQHMPVGFYVFHRKGRVTETNFQGTEIHLHKMDQYRRVIVQDLRLVDGESYVVVPYPKLPTYPDDVQFKIRLRTYLPSDTEISFGPFSENDNPFLDIAKFKSSTYLGQFELLTSSGGDVATNPMAMFNPQFGLICHTKTKIHMVIRRYEQNWRPIAVYVIQRFAMSESRVCHLAPMKVDEETGLIVHTNSVGHKIIEQTPFTSGYDKKLTIDMIIPSGDYVILVCSQVVGLHGSFQMILKTHKPVEVEPYGPFPAKQVVISGAFYGGRNDLTFGSDLFKNNPSYDLDVLFQTHDVSKIRDFDPTQWQHSFLFRLQQKSPPPFVQMKLFVVSKDSGEVVLESSISQDRVVLGGMLVPGKYLLILGCEPRSEAEYSLTVEGAPIQPPRNLNRFLRAKQAWESDEKIEEAEPEAEAEDRQEDEVELEEEDDEEEEGEVVGESVGSKSSEFEPRFFELTPGSGVRDILSLDDLSFSFAQPLVFDGLVGPSDVHVQVQGEQVQPPRLTINNPRFEFSVEEQQTTLLVLLSVTDQSVVKVGIRVLLGSRCVSDTGVLAIQKTLMRHVQLSRGEGYVLEIYPKGNVDSASLQMEVRSSCDVGLTRMVKPTFSRVFETGWDYGRQISAWYSDVRFAFNPHLVLRIKKDAAIAFAVERDGSTFFVQTPSSLSVLKDDILPRDRRVGLFFLQGRNPEDTLFDRISDGATLKDFVRAETWGDAGRVCSSLLLAASENPYFCVPVATSTPGRKNPSQQSYVLKMCSDLPLDEDVVIHRNLMLPPVRKRRIDKDTETFSCRWSFHGAGNPHRGSQNWIHNERVSIEVDAPSRIIVSMRVPRHVPNVKYGFAIVSPPDGSDRLRSDLNENLIVADTSLLPQTLVERYYVALVPGVKYFFVPFASSNPIGSMEVSLSPKSEIRARVVPGAPTDGLVSWCFQSGWPEGVCSCVPEEDIEGFLKNPSFQIRVLRPNTRVEFLLCSQHLEHVLVYVTSEVCGEEPTYPVCLNECGVGRLLLAPGTYVFTPTLYPSRASGAFTFCIGAERGTLEIAETHGAVWGDQKLLDNREQVDGVWKRKFSSGYANLDRLKRNPVVFVECNGQDPWILDIELTVRDHCLKCCHFWVTTVIDGHDGDVLFHPLFRPFQMRAVARLFLDPGQFHIYVMCDCYPEIIDENLLRFRVRLTGSRDFEISFLETKATVKRIPPGPVTPQMDERFEMIANNVRTVQSSLGYDRRFAAPLCVYGVSAWPIMTGIFTTRNLYDLSTDEKRRKLIQMDKWGVSSDFVDSHAPFVAAGDLGAGCVVAIGDPHVFSSRNLHRADNRTFLLNCAEFVMKKAYDNLDVLDGLGSGMGRRKRSAEDLQLQLQSATEAPRGKRLVMLVHSRRKELVPVADLERTECRVSPVTSLKRDLKRCGDSLSALFLVFEDDEMMDRKDAARIQEAIESGVGAIIMSKCSKHSPRGTKVYPANYLLSAAGIVIGRGEVVQNTAHDHSDIHWLGYRMAEKIRDGTIMPNLKIRHEALYAVTPSREAINPPSRYRVDHVLDLYAQSESHRAITALKKKKKNRKIQRGGQSRGVDPRAFLELFHILEIACCSIPLDDTVILPILRSRFAEPFYFPDEVAGDSGRRLGMGLSSNCWFNRSKYPEIADRRLVFQLELDIVANDDLRRETTEIVLERETIVRARADFLVKDTACSKHSLGVYALPGEKIDLEVPSTFVDSGSSVVIGNDTANLWWCRDSSLSRYPVVYVEEPISSPVLSMSNVLGGAVYLLVSPEATQRKSETETEEEGERIRPPLGDIPDSYVIRVEGGTALPRFVHGETDSEDWEAMIRDSRSEVVEWVSESVVVVLPISEARLFLHEQASRTLRFWDRIVEILCEFLGKPKTSKFRILADGRGQVMLGATGVGMEEIRVNCDLFWEMVVVRDDDDQYGRYFWVIVKEIASRLLRGHRCFWRGRHDAVLNVLVAYVLHRLHEVPLAELGFITPQMLSDARLHVTSTKTPAEKRRELEKSVGLTTLFELGFVQGFGWDCYGWYFQTDSKEQFGMANPIDSWVSSFSTHVERDVSMYVELWGLPVSGTVKMELKRLQRWVAAGLEGGEGDETFSERQLGKDGTFQADQLMPI